VTEFTATAGQTTFSVPSYTVGYINVYRNGLNLGTADFTATNGTTVVLAAAATAGDLIATESFYVSSVLNAIPATAGAVNSTYITDNAVTTAKIADANVTTAKIADENVTTAKILAANVTQAKLETLVVPLGVSQTWQNVTGSRATGTTYTNSTGRPITVCVLLATANLANGSGSLNVGGLAVAPMNCYVNASTPPRYAMTVVVPSGSTYSASVSSSSLASWYELR
jgi:hypothetical protein